MKWHVSMAMCVIGALTIIVVSGCVLDPGIDFLEVHPDTVHYGDSAIVSWGTHDTNECEVAASDRGRISNRLSGTYTLTYLRATTVITIVCIGPSGASENLKTVNATATVTVTE